MQFLCKGFLLIAACAALTLNLKAQAVIYATDFADDQGWTFTSLGPGYPWWAVDATPTSVAQSPSWLSAPYSLNFNNDVNYTPMAHGTATSPWIDLSGDSGHINLGFWCNWNTEVAMGCGWDVRRLEVSNDGFQSVVGEICYTSGYGGAWGTCGPPGQWHFHSFPLPKEWGAVGAPRVPVDGLTDRRHSILRSSRHSPLSQTPVGTATSARQLSSPTSSAFSLAISCQRCRS